MKPSNEDERKCECGGELSLFSNNVLLLMCNNECKIQNNIHDFGIKLLKLKRMLQNFVSVSYVSSKFLK